MKFLCDVHISHKLVKFLSESGFESVHVNNILNKWHTSDSEISHFADANDFIVVSKDSDFKDSFYIKDTPKKLIKINLGNISNSDLINVFRENMEAIKKLNRTPKFIIEIDHNYITFGKG